MVRKLIAVLVAVAFLSIGALVLAQSDTIDIKDLAKVYDAAKYPHKKHVDAKIECIKCHHKGDKKKCSECHKAAGTDKVPSLKDAYHKQCKDCHTASKAAGKNPPTSCTGCHAKKG